MCLIVVALGVAPSYRLVVAANRDELHARPTRRAGWWKAERVFGGRDLEAGGTWLAVDHRGRFAAVTNIRDSEPRGGRHSRGTLAANFLRGSESAARYAVHAASSGADFGAFNLLLYDGRELHFASNRAAAVGLPTGLHAFSNAPPGTEWPKTTSALAGAEQLLTHPEPIEPLFALLAERDGLDADELRRQRSHFVVGPIYGTRCSTVVLIGITGRLTFAERMFDAAGILGGEVRESFELDRRA
jgi:uncharacterized protein with NRDE domain